MRYFPSSPKLHRPFNLSHNSRGHILILNLIRKRASMSEEQKFEEKRRRKEANQKYYLKNRERLLGDARTKRSSTFISKYGETAYWNNYEVRLWPYKIGLLGKKEKRDPMDGVVEYLP
ncbi:hypothetical protein E1B28_013889 [Marasmius oreades]|uniref:Uncharacterized protein n=1 Tax=Marasmius oreades TaxID=181124 RepID=A0A9P7RLA2_9AGAR|nr:uncharacterized protein E1B28_013889 [Marasmius oreades]KAG7085268.1 hypothetical protein E1B28_013889 [Marasmius oreades]